MNVARPAGGFRVVVDERVEAYIKAETEANFRIAQLWKDILDRIKITGLREGTQLSGWSLPTFTFLAEGAPHFSIPTIQLVYSCFGDTLTVRNALVWKQADHEEG